MGGVVIRGGMMQVGEVEVWSKNNEEVHPTTTIAIATAIAIVAQQITTTTTTQAVTTATTTDLVDYLKDYPIEQS